MPHLYGMGNDGHPFDGVAVKLYHGTAIRWDGHVICHCTSLTSPDGPGTQFGLGKRTTCMEHSPLQGAHCKCGTTHCSCFKEKADRFLRAEEQLVPIQLVNEGAVSLVK